MDDFVARADLLPADRVRELSARSDAKGLARLAAHVSILAATGGLVWLSRGSWWLLPAMAAHGVVLVFLFCAFHESVHRTAFRRRWLNDVAATITGIALFYPPFGFRLYHYAHHRFTQDPERDPELYPPPAETIGGRLKWVTGLTYWPAQLRMTLRPALTGRIKRPYVRERDVPAAIAEARWMWAAYAAVALLSLGFQSWAAVVYWLGPLVLGQPFLRLYLQAEHKGCPLSDDMTENTRTTRTNGLVRLLTWNMPYHAEHHLFPSVPFHALPLVHAEIDKDLHRVDPGYIAVHRTLWRGPARNTEVAHG